MVLWEWLPRKSKFFRWGCPVFHWEVSLSRVYSLMQENIHQDHLEATRGKCVARWNKQSGYNCTNVFGRGSADPKKRGVLAKKPDVGLVCRMPWLFARWRGLFYPRTEVLYSRGLSVPSESKRRDTEALPKKAWDAYAARTENMVLT